MGMIYPESTCMKASHQTCWLQAHQAQTSSKFCWWHRSNKWPCSTEKEAKQEQLNCKSLSDLFLHTRDSPCHDQGTILKSNMVNRTGCLSDELAQGSSHWQYQTGHQLSPSKSRHNPTEMWGVLTNPPTLNEDDGHWNWHATEAGRRWGPKRGWSVFWLKQILLSFCFA